MIASAMLYALAAEPSAAAEPNKRVLMIAGPPSHGFGAHEHYAGLKILADVLQNSGLGIEVTVVKGWPQDASLLASADSIVIYSDGGGGHVALPHRDALASKLKTGAGFVCIHYATEVPKGDAGNAWLKWLGGYFETDWSVIPHWVANFDKLPANPVTKGVKPFATNDEWYFHLRFADAGGKVTPILQAVAPEDTMRRGDGPHSGNPAVRKSVAAKEPQTVAWTFEREDGGRSFGFTGGHFHWNWGNPDVLRLVSNAILWTTKTEVPADGIKLPPVGMQRLLENQDFAPPPNFNPQQTAKEFSIDSTVSINKQKPRALYSSPVVNGQTPGHRVNMDVSIKNVKDLYLVVTDGGDGYACDWVDWLKPTLHAGNQSKSLLDLNWVSAVSGWVHRARIKIQRDKRSALGMKRSKIQRLELMRSVSSIINYQRVLIASQRLEHSMLAEQHRMVAAQPALSLKFTPMHHQVLRRLIKKAFVNPRTPLRG